MHEPVAIVKESFQKAWIAVAKELISSHWEIRNLVVSIQNPMILHIPLHELFIDFSINNGLMMPKDVAYTIFPHNLYKSHSGANALFNSYNRKRGLYERLRKRPHHGWGTYFRRMTHYETISGPVNQLRNIIDAINKRAKISKSAFTIIIQKPGGENVKPQGSPCLNYLSIQLDASNKSLGILAVYRNHDFLVRAYGNYWGLCNLLQFMAHETDFNPGVLTCISSRAYVSGNKDSFKSFAESLS